MLLCKLFDATTAFLDPSENKIVDVKTAHFEESRAINQQILRQEATQT